MGTAASDVGMGFSVAAAPERRGALDPSVELIRRNRSFAWYWFGQAISSAGSQITFFALPLVTALTLDGSAGDVGAVATAGMLPYLLFSLLAGHWLEGRQGRATMISANLSQAVVLAIVPIAAWGSWLSVPLLAGVAFLSGTAALVFGISAFAYIPALVRREDLTAANRAVQASATVDEIVGPGLAGALVGVVGPAVAILVDAVSYLVSAVGLAKSRPQSRRVEPAPTEEAVTLASGLGILFTHPYLRALTIHAAAYNFAEQVFLLNLVLWAVKEQGVSEALYGLALSAAGIGGLIGTLIALKLANRFGFGRAFAASVVLSCYAPLAAAAWEAHGVTLALFLGLVMLISAIGLGNANVYSLTLRQTIIPEGQLSRSAGAYAQVMYGSIPVGSAAAGMIGETLGTRTGVVLGGVGLAVSALPMMTRGVRALRVPTVASGVSAGDT